MIRVKEHVAVIECSHQPDVARQQHAVAEDVAGHVAHTRNRERCRLDVDVHLAEMALHRFPGAARGNTHLLVVVAGRTARGEGVVQPEPGLLRQAVGRIGKGRRALVGGDDEIGVVAIRPKRIGWRHDLAGHDVVSDRQKGADIGLVGFRAGREDRVAGAARRQALRVEAALRADRNDHGILDLLRLDETQHFGSVILRAVRPADAAAGHLAEAQVDALDLRTVDEDFTEGLGLRQAVDLMRVELEGERGERQAVKPLLEIVGAQRGADHIHVAAQDPVVVEAWHGRQPLLDTGDDFVLALATLLAGAGRIKPRDEKRKKPGGDVGILVQRVGNIAL